MTFLASSTDWDSEVASLINTLCSTYTSEDWFWAAKSLIEQILSRKPKMEFISLTQQIQRLMFSDKLRSEWKLVVSFITQIISFVSSMDLDSQQKPEESELISLIKQIISLFNSKPDSETELVSLITQIMHLGISEDSDSELLSLTNQLDSLKMELELTSLVRQIISRFKSMTWEPSQLISLCPQVKVKLDQGKFGVTGEVHQRKNKKKECSFRRTYFFRSTRKYHFWCKNCNGEFHEEYEKGPPEVKHPLHPKHTLHLVLLEKGGGTRECYCCDEDLMKAFYYCDVCDFAMNIACVQKKPVLSLVLPKWHEHTLVLFPSQASLPCILCALADSTSFPLYICPPCDFVVHKSCLNLPHVIRISRHPHRISFTPSFDRGDWSCSVCRKEIGNNKYGGYSCIKEGCSYAAHSRCATQTNVWDGIDLEGVPEEIEEEEALEPFVRISDGIIQHFSHDCEHHHLRLDETRGRDYDDDKQCQACIMSIYFGNFYSCLQCEFILHEACANLSRKIHHPIHPHMLTLVGGYDGVMDCFDDRCSSMSVVNKNVVVLSYTCSVPQFQSH